MLRRRIPDGFSVTPPTDIAESLLQIEHGTAATMQSWINAAGGKNHCLPIQKKQPATTEPQRTSMSSSNSPKSTKTGKKDAITMLMEDHKRVKELFQEFTRFESMRFAAYDELRQDLMDAVCSELKVHTRLEEEIFYPEIRESLPDGTHMASEAEVEHATAKSLIHQIEESNASDPLNCARFKVLGEYIANHVLEEETEMFPAIRHAGIDLFALGAKMARRKEQLVFELAEQQFHQEIAPVGVSIWSRLCGAARGFAGGIAGAVAVVRA
ncbi:MAG: hemerythrin domain-containing protein [Betaproteobacteria bacterium]